MKLHDFGEWFVYIPTEYVQPYLTGPRGTAVGLKHTWERDVPKRYSDTPTPIEGYTCICMEDDGCLREIYTEWRADGTPVRPCDRSFRGL
jgi:hypothetical protein